MAIYSDEGGTEIVSVRRDLPTLEPPPVSSGRPALAATKVRLATVAARYSLNFVQARYCERA